MPTPISRSATATRTARALMIERTLGSLAIERSLEGYSSVITCASHSDYVDSIKLIKSPGLRYRPSGDVRFGSEADIDHVATHVPFGPEADIESSLSSIDEIGRE